MYTAYESSVGPGAACGFFFASRRRHTRCSRDWSSDVCSSDLAEVVIAGQADVRPLPGPLAARVRLGAVAHDVAQAPDSIHARVVDLGQHGLQGRTVAVDVGDDGDAHGERG